MALIDEILRTVFEPVAGRDRKMANPDQYAGPIKQLANIVERYERIASDIRESDTQEQLQSLRKPVYSSHQEEQILQLLRKKTERTKLLECNMLTIQKIAHRTARYRRSEIFEQHTIPQPDTPPENIYTDWMNRYPERIFA
ncbi:MAG: hypothetical protein R3D66_00375 [Alphaproteobacteria bacterium]